MREHHERLLLLEKLPKSNPTCDIRKALEIESADRRICRKKVVHSFALFELHECDEHDIKPPPVEAQKEFNYEPLRSTDQKIVNDDHELCARGLHTTFPRYTNMKEEPDARAARA